MSDKNIYQRINAVMSEAEYIKKGSAGQGTGVQYDEVIAMLRGLLTKNGIVIAVDFLADSFRITEPKKNYIYQGFFKVSYINIDKPEDRLVTEVVAHAMDAGDKAPGKAITYATTISMLKVFSIETGINDEARNYYESSRPDIISEEEAEIIKGMLKESGADVKAFCKNFGCSAADLLPVKEYKRAKAMLTAKLEAK